MVAAEMIQCVALGDRVDSWADVPMAKGFGYE